MSLDSNFKGEKKLYVFISNIQSKAVQTDPIYAKTLNSKEVSESTRISFQGRFVMDENEIGNIIWYE